MEEELFDFLSQRRTAAEADTVYECTLPEVTDVHTVQNGTKGVQQPPVDSPFSHIDFRTTSLDKNYLTQIYTELLEMVFYPDTVDTTVQNVLECIRINIQNHSSDNRNVALWKAKLVIVLLYKLLPNKVILQPLHRYFFLRLLVC